MRSILPILLTSLLFIAPITRADLPPSNDTPWLSMDRGPYFSASVECYLPQRQITPKGLIIRVSKDKPAYVLFDTDLLRYSCGWTGGSINFHNVLFDGSHQTWSRVVGDEIFGNGMTPGWAKDGSFDDPRQRFPSTDYLPQPQSWQNNAYGPLPHDYARYKGLYVHGDRIVLSYTVGGIPVLDSPGFESDGSLSVFTRTLDIAPHEKEMVLQAVEHPVPGGGVADGPRLLETGGPADHTLLMVGAEAPTPGAPQTKAFEGLLCAWTLDPRDTNLGGASNSKNGVEFHGGTFTPKSQTHDRDSLTLRRGDYAILKDSNSIELSEDFSIAAWIKTSAGGTILAKAAPGKWVAGGKSLFVRTGVPTFDIGWVGNVAASHRVNDNQWHHVALTYARSDGAAKMYVDGSLDSEARLRSVPDPKDSSVRFGITSDNFPGGNANRFAGELGTIQLFNKVLDAAQIAALSGEAKRRVLPLAVAVVGADNRMRWEITPQSQRRLHLPPSQTPTRIKLLIAPISGGADIVSLASVVKASRPAEDLTDLTHGGPAHWTQEIETHGVLNPAAKPYVIDTLTLPNDNPWKAEMRPGGFDFFNGGHRAAVCTWDGDVWTVDGIDDTLQHLRWKRIATGLFQPLGLKIVPNSKGEEEIYVTCRDQIARLHDLNGDGETDFYESFNNDHQVTQHFHEFAMDLQTDPQGNFYYTKGGRHALPAVVPHHGTILKVSHDGSKTEIVATGFRAPNGLGLGPNGEIVTSDQEGHWTPANRIDLIKPGGFYGYMWSYAGKSRKTADGYDPPLCWLPVKLDRSPAEELWVTSDRWGPLKGRMIHTSYGTGKLFLVMHESVKGVPQGGVVQFPDLDFNTGTMRARFNPADGQLYVCGLVGWATNLSVPGGFFRVRYTNRKVYLPVDLHVAKDRVSLTFTEPLDRATAADVQSYAVQQWQYRWAERYGSPEYRVSDPSKEGHDDVNVTGAALSPDAKTVTLKIPGLKPVMQMQIEMNIEAADHTPVQTTVTNTINSTGNQQ